MRTELIRCATLAASIALLATNEGHGDGDLQIQLSLPKKEFVLGEVVDVTVTVRNTSKGTLKLLRYGGDDCEPHEHLYISHNGKTFVQHKYGFSYDCHGRDGRTLASEKSFSFEFRILWTRDPTQPSAGTLVFENPGCFQLYVDFPLWYLDPETTERLRSNTVQVNIVNPTGADAKLWTVIRQPEFLEFLQFSGIAHPSDLKIAILAAQLLECRPKTRYHRALQFALQRYYDFHTRHLRPPEIEQDPNWSTIHKALGLKKTEELFPKDSRLDLEITYHYPTLTPFEHVLADLTQQSGVYLTLDRELQVRRRKCVKQTEPLRAIMGSLQGLDCSWIPEMDGYRLVLGRANDEQP